jgi:hypothetical protein
VDAGELILRGRPGLYDAPPPSPELRGDDLHDFRAFYALGMARGRQMIGESVGSNENK